MTTGDIANFETRFAGLLPPSWFDEPTPVKDAVVAGFAGPLSWDYSLYVYTLLQARIKTATGVWLDRIAYDFCGTRLPRRAGESDTLYRARIIAEILRPRVTRAGISQALSDLTGKTPVIIEFWNTGDVGAWDIGNVGFDVAGMWGDTTYNNQIFVTAYRPEGEGFANVAGYDNPATGWDIGTTEFVDLTTISAVVKDSDIYNAVAQTVSAGKVGWTAIESSPNTTESPRLAFMNIQNTQYLPFLLWGWASLKNPPAPGTHVPTFYFLGF
jgi:hypothetical protein